MPRGSPWPERWRRYRRYASHSYTVSSLCGRKRMLRDSVAYLIRSELFVLSVWGSTSPISPESIFPHLWFSFIFMPEYLIVDKRLLGLHSPHTAGIICFKRLDISGFSEWLKKIISLLLLINEVELSWTKELNCLVGLIKKPQQTELLPLGFLCTQAPTL